MSIDITLKLICNCTLFHYGKYVEKKAELMVFQNSLKSTVRVGCMPLSKAQNTHKR